MPDDKMILMAPPPENWRRPPRHPRITWLNIVQRELRTHDLTLNEVADVAQNRPLWRLTAMYGATQY